MITELREPGDLGELEKRDISKEVSDFFARDDIDGLNGYIYSLYSYKHLKMTVDYTTLIHAKWVKGFLEMCPDGQKRTATIRATKAQKREAANVFSSGVQWEEV